MTTTPDKIKKFIDANVWDGEDRSGCNYDSASFTPDGLQELSSDLVEHLLQDYKWLAANGLMVKHIGSYQGNIHEPEGE